MPVQTEIAHAKLNLRLRVTGRRADGYHLLSMLNVALDLCDVVRLEKSGKGIFVEGGDEFDGLVPAELNDAQRNLVGRAISLCNTPCAAKITKNIPLGAGLGGGSADAAAALRALQKLADRKLSDAELLQFAEKLGADVPFSLGSRFAKVSGIGERIENIDGSFLDSQEILLVLFPAIHSTTAEVFKRFRLNGTPVLDEDLGCFSSEGPQAYENLLSLIANDLQAVVCEQHPPVGEALKLLSKEHNFIASMSGSGSSIFAIPRSKGGSVADLESRVRSELQSLGGKTRRTRLVAK